MNSSYEIIDGFTINDFDNICKQFDTRCSEIEPKGGSKQGSLTSNTYAQLIYPAFYKVSIFQPETDGTLMEYYKSGNWYVPSITEMSLLIAHRIISTTTAASANDSISDWYKDNATYNDKGIFNNINKNYFIGFLENLKDEQNNYVYITSEVVAFKNAVYTMTSNYSNQSIGWKASYTYNSYNNNYISNLSDSYGCRRDVNYVIPMCCQITINKNE